MYYSLIPESQIQNCQLNILIHNRQLRILIGKVYDKLTIMWGS